MHGYFCIGFIDFTLKGRSLLDNKKICCIVCVKYKKFKNPKISYIFEKRNSSFYYLQ